jgi:carboxy-terminal domain RNA polymerase II polypeptide A small phosphatase
MENKSNNLIIFDLDETLIHARLTELDYPFHHRFDDYFVYQRPLLQQFLLDINEHFTIGVWSSAGDSYVNAVVEHIMPKTIEPLIIWGQSRCSYRRDITYDTYTYEKRLDKLKKKGFRLEQILIIDDTPEKSRTNYGNAIYIKEFTGDTADRELQFLYNYLLTFKHIENVRSIEKRGWRTNQ